MQALVIIDDAVLSRRVVDYLSEQGFFVTCATANREPLEQILTARPRLLVLDLTMSRLQGLKTLLQIRRHPKTASLTIVALTTREQLEHVHKGWQAGLDWYLLKPVTEADLSHAMEHILDSEDEKVQLAVASPQDDAATPHAEPLKSALAVDDDKDVARLVATFLESEGFTVALAYDAREALDQIREKRPSLVVLDVEMPGMDGLELLRYLRTDSGTADLPVVLLTGRDEISDLFEGWDAGANMYVTKPFEKQTLLDAISAVTA